MKENDTIIKRKIKDIIFHEAIATEDNLPEIYKVLYPEERRDFNKNEFVITSLDTILTNNIVNDLSMLNQTDSLMVFLEAQSSWNTKDFVRFTKYIYSVFTDLGSKYNDFVPNEVNFEVFVLSTSGKEPKQKRFNLLDYIENKATKGQSLPNVHFNIISRKNENVPKGTIIDEYFKFCEIQTEVYKEHGRNRKAFKILIERCIKENILKEFMEKNKVEIMKNLGNLYDQEQITREIINDHAKKAIAERNERFYNLLIEEGFEPEKAHKLAYES